MITCVGGGIVFLGVSSYAPVLGRGDGGGASASTELLGPPSVILVNYNYNYNYN